jgi:hypothetical protein
VPVGRRVYLSIQYLYRPDDTRARRGLGTRLHEVMEHARRAHSAGPQTHHVAHGVTLDRHSSQQAPQHGLSTARPDSTASIDIYYTQYRHDTPRSSDKCDSTSRFFWTGNMRRAVLPVGVTRPEADFDVSTNKPNSPLREAPARPEFFWTLHLVTSNFFDFYTFNEGPLWLPWAPGVCAAQTRSPAGAWRMAACVQWPMAMPWQRASACVRACKRTARSI